MCLARRDCAQSKSAGKVLSSRRQPKANSEVRPAGAGSRRRRRAGRARNTQERRCRLPLVARVASPAFDHHENKRELTEQSGNTLFRLRRAPWRPVRLRPIRRRPHRAPQRSARPAAGEADSRRAMGARCCRAETAKAGASPLHQHTGGEPIATTGGIDQHNNVRRTD
jgi:hypothetical protein